MRLTDYIRMQNIWQDDEITELNVVCSSEVITASAKIYVSDSIIDDLIYQIKQFLNGNAIESFWANEELGDNSTACVSLHFLHKDKLGHLLVEVYMELDDGGKLSTHNCCFYINTEVGLLTEFCERLPRLKKGSLDATVVLNGDVIE